MKTLIALVVAFGVAVTPTLSIASGECYPSSVDETEPSPKCEAQTLKQDVAGLWTNPNPVGQQIPQGALKRADNVTIDRPGVATSIRGMERKAYSLPGGVSPRAIFEYSGLLYVWGDNGTLYKDTGSGYTSVGSAPELDGARIRHATGGGDLYVTSNDGVLVQDGPSAALAVPGAPQALDLDPASSGAGPDATGWLDPMSAVAYRAVIGVNDNEGRPVLGKPSGRSTITSDGVGTIGSTTTRWMLPPGVTTSHFFQLYRTTAVASSVDPGDTMGLVYEAPITSGQVAAGEIILTDNTPDALIGTPLYTNPDRGGERNANARPPLAADVVTFRNRLWLANTTAAQTLTIRMLGVPAAGDTIVIGGTTYTAVNGFPDYSLGQFEIYPSGTVSKKIQRTAASLVAAINTVASNTTVDAYYISGAYDAPGQINLVGRTVSGAAFTATASAPTKWAPELPASPASTSSASVYPNRLHYSKDGLFYAFPLSNTLQVGAEESAILRTVALRDTLFVFKAGNQPQDGLWKVTGHGPFYVDQVNATVRLLSPDAVAVVDNTIFALTDEGVAAITESAVDVISVPVDDLFKALVQPPDARAAVEAYAFAVARDSATEKKVYFWLPEDGDSTAATQALVWNQVTQTWTKRTDDDNPMLAGHVTSQGQLVLGIDGDNRLLLERRTGTVSDYIGPLAFSAQLVDAVGANGLLSFPDADLAQWEAGMVIMDTSGEYHRILSVNPGMSAVYVADNSSFAELDEVDVYERLPIAVEWNTETASSPDTLKQFYEATVLFEQSHTAPFPTYFSGDGGDSDENPVLSEAEATPYVRAEVPFDTQETSRLGVRVEHNVCAAQVNIVGMSTRFRPVSPTLP